MCVACVGAASPEIAVALGGYAAARFGRPVHRVRGWLAGRDATSAQVDPDGTDSSPVAATSPS
jgi:hypothetical protein